MARYVAEIISGTPPLVYIFESLIQIFFKKTGNYSDLLQSALDFAKSSVIRVTRANFLT